jgi:flagellar biosynthetic protein FlhB
MPQSGERSEKPTQRRLQKARREGKVASSRDFIGSLQFTVFIMVLGGYGPAWFASFRESERQLLGQAFRSDLGPSTILAMVHDSMAHALIPVMGWGGVVAVSTLALQLVSTRFSLSLGQLTPKPENFNIISKLKQAPSRGIPSAIQAVALVVVFAGLLYWMVNKNASILLTLPLASLESGLKLTRSLCMDLLWKGAAFFLLFGVIDLFRQQRRFANQMKMTKQEVRDDNKETEGHPQIKMRIRRLQRDFRRRKMMSEVKTATAVVVNPTHYAVAIRYRHESMSAPLVVAKGKNYMALRIRAMALEHDIPLVENPPLAQALYKSVEVGREIPPHLYRAVAEILAYIYKLMGTKAS